MGHFGDMAGAWSYAGGRGLFFLFVIMAAGYLLLRFKRRAQTPLQPREGFKVVQRVQIAPRNWLILIEYQQRLNLVGLGDGCFSVLDRQPAQQGDALALEEPKS
ncbi:MAG: FliO/MopB family protein [Deltaproteobacteria bacterium]|nr:FliO/MopB family protein [Deltaproteobacteria bacterium]